MPFYPFPHILGRGRGSSPSHGPFHGDLAFQVKYKENISNSFILYIFSGEAAGGLVQDLQWEPTGRRLAVTFRSHFFFLTGTPLKCQNLLIKKTPCTKKDLTWKERQYKTGSSVVAKTSWSESGAQAAAATLPPPTLHRSHVQPFEMRLILHVTTH